MSRVVRRISVSDAIDALREDLIESAKRRGPAFAALFKISEATIELEVVAERQTGAEGSVGFWVFTAGASGSRSTASTHRIAVKLVPATGDDAFSVDAGAGVLVRGTKPRKDKRR